MDTVPTELEYYKQQYFDRGFISHGGRLSVEGDLVTLTPYGAFLSYPDSIKFKVTSVGIAPIVELDNEVYILLVQQADRDGNPWELPSGRYESEKDVNALDTVIREFKEETGQAVVLEQIIPLTYLYYPWDRKDRNCDLKEGVIGEGALQYCAKINFDLSRFLIYEENEDHIQIIPPYGVDPKEIRMMALEKFNAKDSLLKTSHHAWAYRTIRNCLMQKQRILNVRFPES